MKLGLLEREQGITSGGSFGYAVVDMDTTRLTGMIILAPGPSSDHEARDILSRVEEVQGGRNEHIGC